MKSVNKFKKAFIILGVILTIPSLYLFVSTAVFVQSAILVEGEVVSIRTSTSENGSTYLPTIAYEFDNESLEFTSNAGTGNPDTYKRGMRIEILVNPNNPQKAKINTVWETWAATIVVGGLAILVWLAVLAMMRDIIKRKKFIKKMLASGVAVKSTITKIEEEHISASNSGIRVTRTVFRIYAKGLFNNEEREFKSVRIQKNPQGYGVNIGDSVTVYVDPKKPKKTYFDFSHIQFSEDFY